MTRCPHHVTTRSVAPISITACVRLTPAVLLTPQEVTKPASYATIAAWTRFFTASRSSTALT